MIAQGVRYQRPILPRHHPSSLFDRHLSVVSSRAEEPSSNQILRAIGDHVPSPDTRGTLTSSSVSRFGASDFPVRPGSADSKAPTTSSAPHVTSCNRDASETAQLRSTENASNGPSRYQCQWEVVKNGPCGEWIEGGSKEIWAHVRTCHGLKGHYGGRCQCKWGGCLEPLNVSSLHRHLAKHLDIKWRCSKCNAISARHDCVRKHIRENKECHGAEAVNAVPSLVSGRTLGMSTEQVVAGASTTSLNW
ncbi:hypothetical protein JVU11DRAFT_7360 [Chiua virens]|nr:hypothetical protein JVU11DRAFT_7360 [Chiua virens]